MDALGDPTRRRIFERLRNGPAAVGQLADGLPVSRPAVSQHLAVLRAAGLVRSVPVGNRRIYQVDGEGLSELRRYFESFWKAALEDYRAQAEKGDGS